MFTFVDVEVCFQLCNGVLSVPLLLQLIRVLIIPKFQHFWKNLKESFIARCLIIWSENETQSSRKDKQQWKECEEESNTRVPGGEVPPSSWENLHLMKEEWMEAFQRDWRQRYEIKKRHKWKNVSFMRDNCDDCAVENGWWQAAKNSVIWPSSTSMTGRLQIVVFYHLLLNRMLRIQLALICLLFPQNVQSTLPHRPWHLLPFLLIHFKVFPLLLLRLRLRLLRYVIWIVFKNLLHNNHWNYSECSSYVNSS